MKINLEVINVFKPCVDRIENFKKEYPNFNGELSEFLKLDRITYKDKIWVSVRLMTKTQKVKFSILCAESVLHIFEDKYPDDKRPRECLEHLKTYESFENLTEEQIAQIRKVRSAAVDAAAYADAAYAAYAYAAAAVYATAADATAADAAYAAYAAAYAAADADADADAAAAYAAAGKTQEEKCLGFVLQTLENL